MEYGVWNRDYDLYHDKWRRPSGSERKVDPATETGKKENYIKKTDRETALQAESPPEKTSLYAPNQEVTQKYGGLNKRESSVVVVGGCIVFTHEVLSSLSKSNVRAFNGPGGLLPRVSQQRGHRWVQASSFRALEQQRGQAWSGVQRMSPLRRAKSLLVLEREYRIITCCTSSSVRALPASCNTSK